MHFVHEIIPVQFRDTSFVSLTAALRNALNERHFVDEIINVDFVTQNHKCWPTKSVTWT